MKYTFLKLLLSVAIVLGSGSMLQAASIFKAPFLDSEVTQPLAIVMLIVIALLLGVIAALGRVLLVSIGVYKKRIADKKEKTNLNGLLWIGLASLTMLPLDSFAQEVSETVVSASPLIGGLSQGSFYFLFGFIIFEVIIILVLLSIFYVLIGSKKEKKEKVNAKKIHWIEKINAAPSSKGITVAEISMGHDFDGIEELDNPTPPWWRWGFVLTLVVSLIYLWRFEIAQTAPNQYQELAIHTEHAEAAVKAYLAKSAANVDESCCRQSCIYSNVRSLSWCRRWRKLSWPKSNR